MSKRRIHSQINELMGRNLRRMRKERGWSQKELADLIGTDMRYISVMERGRGIGKDLLDRLCAVFGVDDEAFTWQETHESQGAIDKLPRVTRMILDELETMPEYKQLRLLAEIVETRMKELEEQLREKK